MGERCGFHLLLEIGNAAASKATANRVLTAQYRQTYKRDTVMRSNNSSPEPRV